MIFFNKICFENEKKKFFFRKVDDLDLTLTIIFEQLESVENDINSINSNIELQRNATNQQINAERLKNMADKAEIEQVSNFAETSWVSHGYKIAYIKYANVKIAFRIDSI